jgi:hypothetical protein
VLSMQQKTLFMNMNPLQLLIYETSGQWAAVLRRELPAGVTISEIRSFEELWGQLAATEPVVALELTTAKFEATLAAIGRLSLAYPAALTLVVANRGLAEWRELVIEAGAAHFIASPRQIGEIVNIIKRHLATTGDKAAPVSWQTN